MNKKYLTLTLGSMMSLTLSAQQISFPGAYGWGRFAMGARGASSPTVYHVTNLNDSGAGSFRDAVSQPGRIVVFDVSGIINISSRITFASNLYVAGQTAPGEGITIYGDGVSFSNSNNLICRYLRVRMGHGGSAGKDCASIASGTNMIFDHCSFAWGLDETFSINNDGKGNLGTITIQNCIVGQGLMTHSAGGLIQADEITMYRNLYCDNSTRNNKVKGISQYSNNIVYNWLDGAYIMGGDSQGKSYVNIESNLFINGPVGGCAAFTRANADFHAYVADNWQDANHDGVFEPTIITNYDASSIEKTPYDYPALDLWSGKELIEKSLPMVGASLPYRDQTDCYMIDEVMSYGTSGALITYETALPIGAPSAWCWWTGSKPTDTDNDGMPDWWENANGTNPNANDACVKAANGYLNIENYINSITAENRQYFLRRPITLQLKSATTSTLTLKWRDYTYAEEGFAIELQMGNEWKEVARTEANATECVVSGLEPGTTYKARVRAFGHNGETEAYSEYSNIGSFVTRPLEVGMVDIDTYKPDVTNNTKVKAGQKLLLHADQGKTFTYDLTADIQPASVVATGAGEIKITGSAITGDTTSMNRGVDGRLVLYNMNSYKGATVNHGGIIEFNTIANGGVNSAIGASQPFAQNWIFDGGTYAYTGGSASTNRNARIDRDATLSIENAGATLTMSGVFEGEGQFTLDGKGTLSIANINFIGYQGATRLKGGKMLLTDTELACKALGESGKKIIMAGGCLQFASKNEDFQNLNMPIEVEDGTHSILSMPTHCYFKAPISGNGTLQFDLPYVRAYLKPDLSNFTGKLVGNGTKSGALFYNESTWNAPQVRFELKGGVTLASWASEATNYIGGLSGDAGTFLAGTSKQNTGFKCTWVVGSANSDETFRGVINNLPAGGNSKYSGTVSITKVGTGLWRLTGNNVYSGNTLVNGGILVINGVHSGTGNVQVATEATLMGKGSIAGRVLMMSGSTLCPGDTLVDGSSLKIKGGLAMQANSVMRIPVADDGKGGIRVNSLSVDGAVSIGQNVVLELDLSGVSQYEFKRGDVIPVFTNSNISTGTGAVTVSPAKPGDGLEWETSTLLIDGMLRVKNEGENYQGGAITTQSYQAFLEHTASVQGGSNEYGKFLDTETHYYNNWGSGSSWFAQAYAQFKLDVPAGEEITKAEYTVYVNCARGTRTFDICYMPVGTPRITSEANIPELTAKVGTQVATYSDILTNYAAKKVEVTPAIQEMVDAGQDYILFIMSNGAAGGNIYGKGSKTYAPTLTITTKRYPTAIEEIDAEVAPTGIYNLSGQRISDYRRIKGNGSRNGLYIINGKKVVI